MHDILHNIAQNYSYSELESLSDILEKLLLQKKKELQSAPTLLKFFREYEIYSETSLSPKYQRSIRQSYKHLLNYFGGETRLPQIDSKSIEQFKQNLMERSPKGFAVYIRTLRASFSIAKEWGYITENPFAKIKLRRVQQTLPVFLSKDEMQQIIDATSNITMKRIFTFAFHTGCRLGEICNLRWQSIDLKNKSITIGDNFTNTKTYKTRTIPMTLVIYSMLSEMYSTRINPQQYVFCKPSGFVFSREYVSRCFKKVCRSINIKEEVHFHSIRHSFATHLATNGAPILTIKDLLGHSSILTTQIYSHTDFQALRAGISKLD